ncbi:MdtA/MuxA family multidrug efflux RND transporter periplasmic adaptor subunit [Aquabacterium soli]|uniref:MdtA/MuxA family multidrug efflux RND transporter periplasmic adaptor subunit n=1 Tax=Aquabacterium soli TaxID=2493092 RepID=A0A3R8TRG6_9BURK|nr:MdtA/MuxA family multidrug efflux RND transporter periplasmic adaptor subunit [Aquabacterium soli]RRS03168.1 MdtA/MuxA family multidrug efflux RND transporter periplasmic adaptor subunit [Aquabacterium soli]
MSPTVIARFAQPGTLRPLLSRHHQAHQPTSQYGKASPWLIGILLALGVGAGWWAWASHSRDASSQAGQGGPGLGASARAQGTGPGTRQRAGGPRPQPVSLAEVRRQDIRITVAAIGTIAAANTALVKPKIEGELKAIHFQEGQWVKAGDLLAEIDARPFQIALAQAQGQLTRDQAQLQNARLDLERFRELLGKDGIAKQQVDTQDALVRQLQGTVQANQAAVDNAQLQLSYTRITAPISGRVGLKQVDLGNVVRPSDIQGLVSISQTQPVNVVFAVPDGHIPLIAGKLKAGAPLGVEAWDRDFKLKLADGKVGSTDNAIDAGTGTIKLKALFANADGGLFPNQSVNVRLQLGTDEGTLAVPGAAVQRGAQGAYVYVLKPDTTVALRTVQTGALDGDWIGVRGNLKAGERVVVDGAERLRDGSSVAIVEASARDLPVQNQRRPKGNAPRGNAG